MSLKVSYSFLFYITMVCFMLNLMIYLGDRYFISFSLSFIFIFIYLHIWYKLTGENL